MATPSIEFQSFRKIPRLMREITVTEKIDGTNAQVYISPELEVYAGSRNRWITPESDNFGFAAWVQENKQELLKLGTGHHFGEWWGRGIQRQYGKQNRVFSLFNVSVWTPETLPACCSVVPTLYQDVFDPDEIDFGIESLMLHGSRAAIGFKEPEGICIYHSAANQYFKYTLDGDAK